ncbi:MAG: ATPase [Halorientalis sp.]
MTVLVAGADRVDAGKTTFSTGLVAARDAVGFKPRAGNDFWFHHDDVRAAVGEGRLYGKDARRHAAASPDDAAPEDRNPVHRLWRPSPGSGTGLLGRSDREFVVDRVGANYVVNDTVSVPEVVREHLPLADAQRVTSLPELNDLMARLHLVALEGIERRVRECDDPVVESYGDVARPLRDIEPSSVAVVEPARVRLYEGSRYVKACKVASGGPDTGQLEERVSAVTDLVDPAETLPLPALDEGTRHDPSAVADAYGHAYDALATV